MLKNIKWNMSLQLYASSTNLSTKEPKAKFSKIVMELQNYYELFMTEHWLIAW